MELTFTPRRVAALVALLVGYALCGGFAIPGALADRETRTWVWTLGLFTLGAIQATVLDHHIGKADRSSLRWFHVIVGICAMAVAATLRWRLSPGS